jgi:uncharacterized protein GlcG (DUF336 family)
MSDGNLVVTQTHVALAPAMEALKSGMEKAKEIGIRVGIAIVDANGHTVVTVRTDGAGGRADEGARGKAVCAAGLGVPTAEFIEKRLVHNEPLWRAMSARPDIFLVQGGYPLKYQGKTVGGVGVSGGKHEEDSQVAEAVSTRFGEIVGEP